MQLVFPEIDEAECLRTHVAAVMKTMGIDGGVYPFDDGARQNAIGRWKGSGGGKTLLFNGCVVRVRGAYCGDCPVETQVLTRFPGIWTRTRSGKGGRSIRGAGS